MNELPKILNYGCGYDLHDDAVNVDQEKIEGAYLSYRDDWVVENHYETIRLYHVIEHLHDPLDLMEELYNVAAPDCQLVIRCPYGSSDDAWENPTHVRPYFRNSCFVFGQQYWWREPMNYRADWRMEEVTLIIEPEIYVTKHENLIDLLKFCDRERNVVQEMIVSMKAIKPARSFPIGVKPEVEHWAYKLVLAPGSQRFQGSMGD